MTRALARLPLALLLIAAVGSLAMADKKGIAILGIEAEPGPTGQIDQPDTDMAKQLTTQLRDRTKQGQGLYTLVPGGDKELVDEKLMNNCASMAPSCMATIGKNLNAQVLMFGTLKKSNATTYLVSLRLVQVRDARMLGSKIDVELPANSKQPEIAKWAKKYYRELTGEDSDGSLQIRVSSLPPGVSATVLIDDQPKGTITPESGSTTITLAEGRYRVAIEAEGFRRWESKDQVTIEAGKTNNVNGTLEPKDTTLPSCPEGTERVEDGTCKKIISVTGTVSGPKRSTTPFKVVAVASLGLGAVGGAFWLYTFLGPQRRFKDSEMAEPIFERNDAGGFDEVQGMVLTEEDCGKDIPRTAGTGMFPKSPNRNGKFRDACDAYDTQKWAIPVTIGFGVVGIGALLYVMAQSSEPSVEQRPANASRKTQRNLSVTPVIMPDGGGATLRFDW